MKAEYLNDNEKAAVELFYKSDVMREAVKKVLLSAIYDGTLEKGQKADPLQNIALVFVSQNLDADDSKLGANLRALYHGINALELGYNKLRDIKGVKAEPEPEENPAV